MKDHLKRFSKCKFQNFLGQSNQGLVKSRLPRLRNLRYWMLYLKKFLFKKTMFNVFVFDKDTWKTYQFKKGVGYKRMDQWFHILTKDHPSKSDWSVSVSVNVLNFLRQSYQGGLLGLLPNVIIKLCNLNFIDFFLEVWYKALGKISQK